MVVWTRTFVVSADARFRIMPIALKDKEGDRIKPRCLLS